MKIKIYSLLHIKYNGFCADCLSGDAGGGYPAEDILINNYNYSGSGFANDAINYYICELFL